VRATSPTFGRVRVPDMTQVGMLSDTSQTAADLQRRRIRDLQPLERLRKGCALSCRGRRMALEAIRRRYPAADDVEVRLRFIEIAYGSALAGDVRRWLLERIT
jgi:hypothetical protein